MNNKKNCKACGAEIAKNAKMCPFCGADNRPPVYQRAWFWCLIALAVIGIVGGIIGGVSSSYDNGRNPTIPPSGNAPITSQEEKATTSTSSEIPESSSLVAPSNPSVFDGDCGITASAEIGSSIIGTPELTISITNITDQDIAAIRFYVVPCDVYGEEITGLFSQNNLYTDTRIKAGDSTSIQYQFLEGRVKTVKLYVYSVYFADGTEWGDKNATKSAILRNGALIEVAGEA